MRLTPFCVTLAGISQGFILRSISATPHGVSSGIIQTHQADKAQGGSVSYRINPAQAAQTGITKLINWPVRLLCKSTVTI